MWFCRLDKIYVNAWRVDITFSKSIFQWKSNFAAGKLFDFLSEKLLKYEKWLNTKKNKMMSKMINFAHCVVLKVYQSTEILQSVSWHTVFFIKWQNFVSWTVFVSTSTNVLSDEYTFWNWNLSKFWFKLLKLKKKTKL